MLIFHSILLVSEVIVLPISVCITTICIQAVKRDVQSAPDSTLIPLEDGFFTQEPGTIGKVRDQ